MKKKNAAPQNNIPQTASLVEKDEVVELSVVALPKKPKTPKTSKVEELLAVEEVVIVKAKVEEVIDPAPY